MAPPWITLGIAPTADPDAIRRAYAKRLKAIGGDPDAFMALRAAFELALAGAPATSPSPQAAPAPANPIARLLDQGAAEAAAEALVAARTAGALSLTDEMALSDRLLHVLGTDRRLDATALRAAASRMGWPDGRVHDSAHRALADRLAAAAWLEELRRRAAWWRALAGLRRAGAARLLLGRGEARWTWLDPPGPALPAALAAFARHERWAGDALDPARVESLRALRHGWRNPGGTAWVLGAGLAVFAVTLTLTRDFGIAAVLAIILPPTLHYRWQMAGLALLGAAAALINN